MTFLKTRALLLAAALTFLLPVAAQAGLVLSTDFEGTTENGMTLQGVTYMTGTGVTVPATESNLTVTNTVQSTGSGNLFTTGAADGVFAVANNTGNGGEWNFTIDFATGATGFVLQDFEFDWLNFNGNGFNQFALRNTEITFDVTAGGSSVVGGPLVQNTGNVNTATAGVQTGTFGLTGLSLAANTNYTISLQAGDATTGGNNFGFEAIRLNAVAVPEPTSLTLFGISVFGLVIRRRK